MGSSDGTRCASTDLLVDFSALVVRITYEYEFEVAGLRIHLASDAIWLCESPTP